MKKILFTTLIMFCMALGSMARHTTPDINITNVITDITSGSINLRFGISANGMDLKCDGLRKLEFAVETADRRLVLPAVIFSGKTRYSYEQRRRELSGGYSLPPYRIYRGVKRNSVYTLEYCIDIPYYAWMEHAAVTWREYTHDCSGARAAGDGVLISDLNPAPVYMEPEVWTPDPELYPLLVGFLQPEVEEVKSRAVMIELNIGFPVNVTDVRPAFGNNIHELQRADSLIRALSLDNDLLTLNGVHIRGYASPEGSYAVNERLARGRSESFKQYLVRSYPDNQYIRNAHTSWVPEDWEGFGRMIEGMDMPGKQDIMSIVNDPAIASDTKDRMLQRIGWWAANYRIIVAEMYPKLRRIELRADYTVHKLDDGRARELLYTNPDMLSQDEIYRVARFYEPGSKQYREVYEIAARQYPTDMIANNNAAAALLQQGNTQAALPYLQKTGDHPASYINYGVYYYISGDLEKAIEYFNRAREAGNPQGERNLELILPTQKR